MLQLPLERRVAPVNLRQVHHRHGHGIVDHHGYRRHQYTGTSHSDHACRRRRNAIDLDSDIALVVHQHIVDLCRCHAVAAGTVDPDGNVARACHQFFFEKLRRDIIIKPAFLGDGAVQEQRSLHCFRLVLLIPHRPVFPLPELPIPAFSVGFVRIFSSSKPMICFRSSLAFFVALSKDLPSLSVPFPAFPIDLAKFPA